MRVLLTNFYDALEGRRADPIPRDEILRVCRLIDRVVVEMGNKE